MTSIISPTCQFLPVDDDAGWRLLRELVGYRRDEAAVGRGIEAAKRALALEQSSRLCIGRRHIGDEQRVGRI